MRELRSFAEEVRDFITANRHLLVKWLMISAGLILALNMLFMLLPFLPIILLVAVPLVGWQYLEWKRRSS